MDPRGIKRGGLFETRLTLTCVYHVCLVWLATKWAIRRVLCATDGSCADNTTPRNRNVYIFIVDRRECKLRLAKLFWSEMARKLLGGKAERKTPANKNETRLLFLLLLWISPVLLLQLPGLSLPPESQGRTHPPRLCVQDPIPRILDLWSTQTFGGHSHRWIKYSYHYLV